MSQMHFPATEGRVIYRGKSNLFFALKHSSSSSDDERGEELNLYGLLLTNGYQLLVSRLQDFMPLFVGQQTYSRSSFWNIE